jgi:hypothetical protein
LLIQQSKRRDIKKVSEKKKIMMKDEHNDDTNVDDSRSQPNDNNNKNTAKQPPSASANTQTPTFSQEQPSNDDFATRTPPSNRNSYLSPDDNHYNEYSGDNGGGVRRILSSQSLVGEDIGGYDDIMEDPTTTTAGFHRTTSAITFDADLSPFTPTSHGDNNGDDDDDGCLNNRNSITPPLSIQKTPVSLSPPLFTNYRSSDSIASSSVDRPISQQQQPHTPTQAQHHQLQPRTHLQTYMISNSSAGAPNYISGQHSVASAGPPTGGGGGGGGRPSSFRARPPRAPTTTTQQQPSSLPSSPAAAAPKHKNSNLQPQAAQPQQQPLLFDGVGRIEQQQHGHGHGHNRIPTDGTNFTFLSALTDFTGDYGLPRRRTMSWDDAHNINHHARSGGGTTARTAGHRNSNNNNTTSNHRNTTESAGRGATTTGNVTGVAANPTASAHESSPTGGNSLPASILQPILMEGESNAVVTPPVSILASNLKKPTPSFQSSSSASVTEGMLIPSSGNDNDDINNGPLRPFGFPSTMLVPRSSSQMDGGPQTSTDVEFFSHIPISDNDGRAKRDEEEQIAGGPTNAASPKEVHFTESDQNPSQLFSLGDVLMATHEPSDETDVIKTVERDQLLDGSLREAAIRSLFPNIDDDRVHDFEETQQSDPKLGQSMTSQRRVRGQRESTIENINDLTKKMMAASFNKDFTSPTNSEGNNIGSSFTTHATQNDAARFYTDAAKILSTRQTAIVPQELDGDIEATGEKLNEENAPQTSGRHRQGTRKTTWRSKAKADLDYFYEFIQPHQARFWGVFAKVFWFVMFPSITVAAILFYLAENPPTGFAVDDACVGNGRASNNTNGLLDRDSPSGYADSKCMTAEEKSLAVASASWWILFIGCRQVVTLGIGKISELIIINFFTFRTRFFPKTFGSTFSLALAQSKGLPYMMTTWGLLNLILNYGDRRFARHWLYWQDAIAMCNETNPSGNVTGNLYYRRLIYISIGLGLAVTLKKTIMGRFIGKRVVGKNQEGAVSRCLH